MIFNTEFNKNDIKIIIKINVIISFFDFVSEDISFDDL
jgi:hypothetical protein